MAVRAAVGDVGADVALLPGAVLPVGVAVPPAAPRHPPPQGHVEAQGQGTVYISYCDISYTATVRSLLLTVTLSRIANGVTVSEFFFKNGGKFQMISAVLPDVNTNQNSNDFSSVASCQYQFR